MTIHHRLLALARHDIARYFIASLAALAIDVATLSACLRLLHLGLAWSASLVPAMMCRDMRPCVSWSKVEIWRAASAGAIAR